MKRKLVSGRVELKLEFLVPVTYSLRLGERRLVSGLVEYEILIPVTYYLAGLNNSSGGREGRLGEAADFLTALFSRSSLKSKYRGLGRRWKS